MGSKHLTTRNRSTVELDANLLPSQRLYPYAHIVQMCHALQLEADLKNYLAPRETIKNAYITKTSVNC